MKRKEFKVVMFSLMTITNLLTFTTNNIVIVEAFSTVSYDDWLGDVINPQPVDKVEDTPVSSPIENPVETPKVEIPVETPKVETPAEIPKEIETEVPKENDNSINTNARYEVRKPSTSLSAEITSVDAYSPSLSGHPWYTFDHIGYKDTAFQGERHVAYFAEEGGVQFYGYDSEPLTDLMLLEHPANENQTITLLQAPIRADWHTLDGNGILFAVQPSGLPGISNKEPTGLPGEKSQSRDIDLTKGSNVTIDGYAAVATVDEIQIRRYYNTKVSDLGTNFEVLYREPKECPSVDFRVEIEGQNAKVYLGTKLLDGNIAIATSGRYSGIMVAYAAHRCPSLSSVYTYSHMVNGVEYLAPREK